MVKKVFVIGGWWIGKKVNELGGYSEGGITVTRSGGKAMYNDYEMNEICAVCGKRYGQHSGNSCPTKDGFEAGEGSFRPTKGGKPMKSKKKYKKGKTIYLQFNCPTNDDDMTMKGSFNKDDMNPDYPFTQVKLTGDVYEMQTVRKVVKVR